MSDVDARRTEATLDPKARKAATKHNSGRNKEAMKAAWTARRGTSQTIPKGIARELKGLRAFKKRHTAQMTAMASVRLEGQEPDALTHQLAGLVTDGKMTSKKALAELDKRFGHSHSR
jgi:hypothetical protein